MTHRLTERLRTHVDPLVQRMIGTAFLQGVASGELPREKFLYHSVMECGYLPQYAQAIASLASRCDDVELFRMLQEWSLGLLHYMNVRHVRHAREVGFSLEQARAASMQVPGLHEYNVRILREQAATGPVVTGSRRCSATRTTTSAALTSAGRPAFARGGCAGWLGEYRPLGPMPAIFAKLDDLGDRATDAEIAEMERTATKAVDVHAPSVRPVRHRRPRRVPLLRGSAERGVSAGGGVRAAPKRPTSVGRFASGAWRAISSATSAARRGGPRRRGRARRRRSRPAKTRAATSGRRRWRRGARRRGTGDRTPG